MKQILFVLIFIFSLTVMFADNREVQQQKVYLKGFLTKPKPMKSDTNIEPVVVLDLDYYLQVTFTQDLGVLVVTITNEQGYDVYQQSVNTSSSSFLVIPTNNLQPGNYIITITGSEGTLSGEFFR